MIGGRRSNSLLKRAIVTITACWIAFDLSWLYTSLPSFSSPFIVSCVLAIATVIAWFCVRYSLKRIFKMILRRRGGGRVLAVIRALCIWAGALLALLMLLLKLTAGADGMSAEVSLPALTFMLPAAIFYYALRFNYARPRPSG